LSPALRCGIFSPLSGEQVIRIEGACTHNLRDIDLCIPRNRLIVITGVSGSGKSSLAFDTLYAEGQRRYVESLSAYARQFLDRMPRPDVRRIDGLTPALAIDQRAAAPNPRSTIGTLTEIHDHLRLLFTALGQPHDPDTGQALHRMGTDEIVNQLAALPERTRLILLAPVEGEGDLPALRDRLKRQGFVRLRLDGEILDLDDPALGKKRRVPGKVEVVVDRLVIRPELEARLADSIETVRRWSPHQVVALIQEPDAESPVEENFSTSFTNPETGFTLPTPEPHHFSFNGPHGACPSCHGLGVVSEQEETAARSRTCPDCHGRRLKPWVLAVTVENARGESLSIDRFCELPVDDAHAWLDGMEAQGPRAQLIAPVLRELRHRLSFLREVGLGYLGIDRQASTLSGGEFQRIRLATQVGGGLSGVLYVLDEPTIGLHPQDNDRLLAALRRLRDLGNTVLLVEHDLTAMREAEFLIDIGPGAGRHGGHLLHAGSVADLLADGAPDTPTRAYLSGEKRITPPTRPRVPRKGEWLALRGARGHNLRNIDLRIPLGCLVAVAGVSGSGKSSLIADTLQPALAGLLHGARAMPLPFDTLHGVEGVDKIIAIDQSPLSRSRRSNPATYSGAFQPIRAPFAATPTARARGYGVGRFSFNRPGGRCEACQGEGSIRLDMQFMADIHAPCESCGGRRFNRETLEITFKGRSIAEVLEMTIDEAVAFFGKISDVARKLESLRRAGLGYLTLGQPAATLSGGEAQRLKLASELARRPGDHTIYLLDEPTTGLHPADIQVLVNNLFALRDQGHTVLVVEHDPDVLRCADWIVELGPGGGPDGGQIIAEGPPAKIAGTKNSPTAPWLR